MTTHPEGPDELQRLWQSQPTEDVKLSLEEIAKRAKKLDKKTQRRDLRELWAALLVAIVFGRLALEPSAPALPRIGAGLVILGTAWIVFYMLRMRRPASVPVEAPTSAHLASLRAGLEHQRRLLATAWLWYVLPFAPGVLLIVLGVAEKRPPGSDARFALVVGVVLLVLVGVALLNWFGAKKIAKELAALPSGSD